MRDTLVTVSVLALRRRAPLVLPSKQWANFKEKDGKAATARGRVKGAGKSHARCPRGGSFHQNTFVRAT